MSDLIPPYFIDFWPSVSFGEADLYQQLYLPSMEVPPSLELSLFNPEHATFIEARVNSYHPLLQSCLQLHHNAVQQHNAVNPQPVYSS